MSSDAIVNSTDGLKRSTNVSGFTNTKFLVNKLDDAETYYPAAYQAWNYAGLPTPATSTGWFMPSIQQWVKMLTALGEMSESDIVWMAWKDQSLTSMHNMEAAMEKAGTKGVEYDGLADNNRSYWSCDESTAGMATCIYVWPTVSGVQQGLLITSKNKADSEYVRPVLAF